MKPKILIFEPYHGGHHTNYIEAVVDQLAGLGDLVICTGEGHAFQAELPSDVLLDTSLPRYNPTVSFKTKMRIGLAAHRAVARHRPDFVISTTGDHEILAEALARGLGLRPVPRRVKSIAITHHGYRGLAPGWKNKVKDAMCRFAFRFSGRSHIFSVNPVVYNALKKQNIPIDIMPDPIQPASPLTQQDARALLGLPPEGRMIGHVGMTDSRKAIPELLRGFAQARAPGDRLLLAGRIVDWYKALIERDYADLEAEGALIVVDRSLSREEFVAYMSACDVIAPLHYPRTELSANFLNAMALRRPVLVDSFGYTGLMTELFDAGVACDVYDAHSVAQGVRNVLDRYANAPLNPAIDRLVAFHQIENFGATLRKTVFDLLGMPHDERPVTWEDLLATREAVAR